MAEYSMANRKIAYPLGRGWAYIFDMSSTSGNMGAKYFQELGLRFFDMSATSGNMGVKDVQEFGPRFLACHVPNIACHGVLISCVSMSSVSCRVIIQRVSVSVPCRGHPALKATRAQIWNFILVSGKKYHHVQKVLKIHFGLLGLTLFWF